MKIRNIVTTSALVVLLGLTGGTAYADDLGDSNSHTPGSATSVLVYDAEAYQAAVIADSDANESETASTDSKEATK